MTFCPADTRFISIQINGAQNQHFTSARGPVEEALTAGRAVCFPLSLLSLAADDAEQLLTHLVTALTQLNRYHRHRPNRPCEGRLPGGVGGFPIRRRGQAVRKRSVSRGPHGGAVSDPVCSEKAPGCRHKKKDRHFRPTLSELSK